MNLFNNKKWYALFEKPPCFVFSFEAIVCGPTMRGKIVFISDLIENKTSMIDQAVDSCCVLLRRMAALFWLNDQNQRPDIGICWRAGQSWIWIIFSNQGGKRLLFWTIWVWRLLVTLKGQNYLRKEFIMKTSVLFIVRKIFEQGKPIQNIKING